MIGSWLRVVGLALLSVVTSVVAMALLVAVSSSVPILVAMLLRGHDDVYSSPAHGGVLVLGGALVGLCAGVVLLPYVAMRIFRRLSFGRARCGSGLHPADKNPGLQSGED